MSHRNPIELVVHPQKVVPFERRPNAESLRSNFLARFNRHFLSKPSDEIFERIDPKIPAGTSAAGAAAKVLKIETGELELRRQTAAARRGPAQLEERAGTDARKLIEVFLKKIDKLEAAALDAEEGEELPKSTLMVCRGGGLTMLLLPTGLQRCVDASGTAREPLRGHHEDAVLIAMMKGRLARP